MLVQFNANDNYEADTVLANVGISQDQLTVLRIDCPGSSVGLRAADLQAGGRGYETRSEYKTFRTLLASERIDL